MRQEAIFSMQPTPRSVDVCFDTWWESYPRKEAKGYARKCFARALEVVDFSVLMEATGRYSAWVAGREQEKVKMPATYLNQQCWHDQYKTGGGSRRANHRTAADFDV